MKEFTIKKGPHLRSSNQTSKMMIHLFIALLPIIGFSFYKNGIIPFIHDKVGVFGMLYPLIFLAVPTITCFLTETLYFYIVKGKRKEELKREIKNSFSIYPGLFLGLILPLNTPISIVILGALFATIIGKLIFGGFGNNIFNPALLGRLFIITTYALVISNHGGYMNPYEVDTITSATPLSNVSLVEGIGTFDTLVKPYGSLWNFFFGTIPGAVGETSALFCLLGFLYLVYTKVIKWKIPVLYIGTVFMMTMIIGFLNGTGIWYPLFQILSGGLFLGAIFMATDPVTSPTTSFGQILYGIGLGILTVIFRYLTPYPEGVLTSILTMNLLVFILDKIGSRARFNPKKYSIILLVFMIAFVGISVGISTKYQKTTEGGDANYAIISREQISDDITYIVTQKGYVGPIKGKIVIRKGKILSFEILEKNESFYQKIEDANYIKKLLEEQNTLENVDTVSGATITSTALKKMLINTIADYKKGNFEEIVPPKEEVKPKEFVILDKKTEQEKTVYTVTQKSFGGLLKLQITFQKDKVIELTVLEQNDSYYEKIIDAHYIEKLLKEQDTLEDIDTVSGATVTSTALKKALINTINDYYGVNHEE